MNVGFIGLGKLGLPCATAMSENGYNVAGYDINPVPSSINTCETIKQAVLDKQFVFVAVPTPHHEDYDGRKPTSHLDPKDFDYSTVESVLKECNRYMNQDQELVLISTVLPGTCKKLSKIVTNTRFIYNPYLIAMGTVKHDMINPEMVIIGGESKLKEFYKTFVNTDRYIECTHEEAECIKVFYNTFISAKIGLVNMIQDVAVKLDNVNADTVASALANSTQRITSEMYMKPGMGDGGSCHPRDNIALRFLAKKLNLGYDLFGSIMKSREAQAENMAIHILKYGNKIQFSSNSYKPSVDQEDGSYSLLVQHYIKTYGGFIVNKDPNVYVLVHPTCTPIDNVLNFDPWRIHTGENIIRYGDYK